MVVASPSAANPGSVSYGPDAPGGAVDGTIWINSANGLLLTYQNGVWTGANVAATATGVADDTALTIGTTLDGVLYLRSTILNANTSLSGVVVGTPVTPAVSANSLLMTNVTADGDILIATQTGGNSHAVLWNDSSAGLTTLYGGAGVKFIRSDGTTVTLSGGAVDVVALTATSVNLPDSILLTLGTGGDQALVNRASILNANTTLTGVIVGTPVTPAIAADTLIVGNVTADGDFLLVTQTGGNSHAAMWVDASAAITRFYSGAGVEVLKLDSAALTATGTLAVTGAADLQASATVTGQVKHGAASDGSTPGVSVAAFKTGTPPVGAATTTSKLYASSTIARKIIADGTDSAIG